MNRPTIFFQRSDISAGAYYRLVLPFLGLYAGGYPAALDAQTSDFGDADILVFRCLDNTSFIPQIRQLQRQGKKVVIDYDDNCFQVEPHNPAIQRTPPEVQEQIKEVMAAADALTVTVRELIEPFSRYNDRIFVLPNCIDENALGITKVKTEKLTIGWQGSPTHQEDLRLIKSVISNLKRKYQLDFILAGYRPPGFFKDCVYRPWVTFADDLSHERLFLDFDIGICPLEKTPFNEAKSDLKFLEYSSLGIPTVASNVAAYKTIKHGETGFLARNLSEWERYLTELIEDEDKRLAIGQAAKEYVAAERTIQKNIHLWEDLFYDHL